jgi:hypothetical protein
VLQTYTGSNLNTFSKAIQEYLDKSPLLPGESVKYRLLNGTKNIDPERKKGEDLLFPASIVIHLRDRIKDPGKDDIKAGIVEIGAVSHFDDRTELPVFKSFIINPSKGDGGYFMLSGDNISDIEMYDVLELKNCNGSNPFRDKSVNALYEKVNEVAESKVAGNIAFNAHENKWIYAGSGETLALLDRREGVDENTGLLYFLKTSVNGPRIQGQLEKLLKSKKP